MINFKNLFLQILAGLMAIVIWESLKFLLNKITEYSNMEHAGITNIWFILFFISVNSLFFLLYYKYSKSDYSKAQKDKRIDKKELLPQKSIEYDILDDCVPEENPGWFRNPITDEKFCSDCWDARKIKKRLKKDWSNWPWPRWICPRCNKPYTSLKRTLMSLFLKRSDADRIIRQSKK